MRQARKVLHLLIDYWYIPALLLGSLVAFWVFRKYRPDKDPLRVVKDELEVIQAGAEARNMAIQLGTKQATEHVKDKYQAKLAALEAQQQVVVKGMEDDPIALARYLERLSR